MGETGGNTEEQTQLGLSRRDAIKRTAIAGGIVWATPTLLSSPAGAQTTISCESCDAGVEAALKIPSNPSLNCGVSCLDFYVDVNNIPCLSDVGLSCLFDTFITVQTDSFVNGQTRAAAIDVGGGIIPLLIGVKLGAPDCCVIASCEDDYVNDVSDCPGADEHGGPVIEVVPVVGQPDVSRILVNAYGRPLNHMELSLCIPNALTGQCDE